MFSPAVRVFVASEPIDLHLSFDRLAGIVRNQLDADPLSGHLFVFFNKTRTRTKILVFDRSGFAVYYKRLERGTFELPVVTAGSRRAEVDAGGLGDDPGGRGSARAAAPALLARRAKSETRPNLTLVDLSSARVWMWGSARSKRVVEPAS